MEEAKGNTAASVMLLSGRLQPVLSIVQLMDIAVSHSYLIFQMFLMARNRNPHEYHLKDHQRKQTGQLM